MYPESIFTLAPEKKFGPQVPVLGNTLRPKYILFGYMGGGPWACGIEDIGAPSRGSVKRSFRAPLRVPMKALYGWLRDFGL